MSKTTNKVQQKKLVELLCEKPDIAQGFTKRDKLEVKLFWENCALELNSLGPPTKDGFGWKKVWLDTKAYIKKKLIFNKKEQQGTGGGPHKQHNFTDVENQIINLIQVNSSVSGIPNTLCFGRVRPVSEDVTESERIQSGSTGHEPIDVDNNDASMVSLEDSGEQPSIRQHTRTPPPSTSKNKKDDTIDLLKIEIEIQKDFYENLSNVFRKQEAQQMEMVSNLKRVYRGIDRLNDGINRLKETKKLKVEELRRQNNAMEELMLQKLKIKQKMLEIQERDLKD